MLRHLFIAGTRALAVSIVIGTFLVLAVGGFDSPDAGSVIEVSAFGLFIFWIVFAFLFRPPTINPHPDIREES